MADGWRDITVLVRNVSICFCMNIKLSTHVELINFAAGFKW